VLFAPRMTTALPLTNKVAVTVYLAAGVLAGLAVPEDPAITLFSTVSASIILAVFMASAVLGLFRAHSSGDLSISPFLGAVIVGIVTSAVWSWSGGSIALFVYGAGYICLIVAAIVGGLLLSALLKILPEMGYIGDLLLITLAGYYVFLGTRLLFDLTVLSSGIGTLNHGLLYLITSVSLTAGLTLALLITAHGRPAPSRRRFNQIFSGVTAQVNTPLPLQAALSQVFLIIRDNQFSRLTGLTVGAYLIAVLSTTLEQGQFYLISTFYLAGLLAIFASRGALWQRKLGGAILAPSRVKLSINRAGFWGSWLVFGLMLLPIFWLISYNGWTIQTSAVIYMVLGFFLAHLVVWAVVLKKPRTNLLMVNLLATLIAAWSMAVILS